MGLVAVAAVVVVLSVAVAAFAFVTVENCSMSHHVTSGSDSNREVVLE